MFLEDYFILHAFYKIVSYYYLKQVYKQTQSDDRSPFSYQQFVTVFIFLCIGTTEHTKLTLKQPYC